MANKWVDGTLEGLRAYTPSANGGVWKWLLKILGKIALVPIYLVATAIGGLVVSIIFYIGSSTFIVIFDLIEGTTSGRNFYIACVALVIDIAFGCCFVARRSDS